MVPPCQRLAPINDPIRGRIMTILPAIESIAKRMVHLTTDQLFRFELIRGHLRLITPAEPEGHRQGRNLFIYDNMARDISVAFALTDFAGVILRFMELFPTEFELLRPQVIALGTLMEYPDEKDNWEKIWK
jgi:hypothetical protein